MLDQNQIAAASQLLVQHWRDGSKLDALETRLRPQSRTEGYDVQAALGSQVFGWKIAATSEAGQKHINVAGPLAGRITREMVIADGGTASMKGNAMRVGEPEFCFRMGRDLAPRPAPYGIDEVLAAVDTLHPAIEIPICASLISPAPARRSSSPTMPAPISSYCVPQHQPIGARWISSRSGRRSRCVASAMSVTARTCSATPRGTGLARQRAARARHHLAGRGGGDDGHVPSAAANPGRRSLCGGFRRLGQGVGEVRIGAPRSAVIASARVGSRPSPTAITDARRSRFPRAHGWRRA